MNLIKMYNNYNFKVTKAKGIYIYSNEEKYIDTFAGIGVMSFGHSYEPLNKVLKFKIDKYTHLSNFFIDKDAEYVAKKLINFTETDGKVFFTNSGTESTETALKAIKKVSSIKKNKIIYFKNGFHGRTTGALSITGFDKLKDQFLPLFQNTIELKFNDEKQFENYIENNSENVIAVYLEGVQGAGGVVPMTKEFAETIKNYHEKLKFILVCDEIQAGLGRTGKIFSYQHYNLNPDIVTVAKSLGGGLPLGAVLFLNQFQNILKKGDHGSTFAPNPISLAGAHFIVDNIENILSEVSEKGLYFIDKLKNIKSNNIKEIRGKGLMIGIELKNAQPNLRNKALKKNLLINILADKVIRLLPSFTIFYEEIDKICNILEEIL
ncbi:acetylornithine aminotransferase [Tepiditoga spiralis]|uniref:Acetylornithine aminotransferase n=1 Tax=Tepiditoga spiralis TaxID=2108365 RepID=A0A7G1G684_9BACT|nr:aminotransferase class III-fold pyridoxal phosphate-dependent enzyme [Tepiditoga spiralis]BBE30856.1 acetylornithine aminotransferase [Tepiditoga spiralis]